MPHLSRLFDRHWADVCRARPHAGPRKWDGTRTYSEYDSQPAPRRCGLLDPGHWVAKGEGPPFSACPPAAAAAAFCSPSPCAGCPPLSGGCSCYDQAVDGSSGSFQGRNKSLEVL